MATLDWHTASEGGVTLVHLLVTSEVTERVRVTNCLDGPVWPPRSQGVPEAGWNADGYEGVVDADDRLVLGYATPADPADPPARLASADPVDGSTDAVSAREVVRTLGDPRPARAAVSGAEHVTGTDDGTPPETPAVERADAGEPGRTAERTPGLPADVEAWFDDVAGRVDDAERLARASSVSGATAAVEDVGGPAAVTELGERLERDRERLDRLADRSRTLADRIESVDVPVETLRRLA